MSRHLALVGVEPPRLYSNQLIFPGSLFRPDSSPLGIVFATYSGETFGPSEALPALELEAMYLQYLFLDVIGKFACPGRKAPKSTIDLLASDLCLSPDEVAQRIGKYERNPEDPIFLGLSEDTLALLHQAVMDKKNGGQIPLPAEFSEEVWHRDLDTRPHSRDLQKARIFLEEILGGLILLRMVSQDGPVPSIPVSAEAAKSTGALTRSAPVSFILRLDHLILLQELFHIGSGDLTHSGLKGQLFHEIGIHVRDLFAVPQLHGGIEQIPDIIDAAPDLRHAAVNVQKGVYNLHAGTHGIFGGEDGISGGLCKLTKEKQSSQRRRAPPWAGLRRPGA